MSAYTPWSRLPMAPAQNIVQLQHRPGLTLDQLSSPLLAFGKGRSYSDVCVNSGGTLISTKRLDRFIAFDPETGVLRCEAGVTFESILDLVVPYGWFIATTPGTQFITLGGAIANDVHGKSHHRDGSFGHQVRQLALLRSDGEEIRCDNQTNSDWLRATIGGLGLTGLIVWAEIQLTLIPGPWLQVKSHRYQNLDEFWDLNDSAAEDQRYRVAWIDCLAKGDTQGRGVFQSANHHAAPEAKPAPQSKNLTVPLTPPISLINNLSLRAFNALYYRQPVAPRGKPVHYRPFFYPLDAIQQWNRIYGRKGFYQYQCVVPPRQSADVISALLSAIAHSGQGSFLAVLKTFGEIEARGMLSFPRAGTTLALDFPNRGADTLKLFDALDSIVKDAGGALYPAKDARMPASLFQAGFPEWEAFAAFVDPAFSSNFWRRVTP